MKELCELCAKKIHDGLAVAAGNCKVGLLSLATSSECRLGASERILKVGVLERLPVAQWLPRTQRLGLKREGARTKVHCT